MFMGIMNELAVTDKLHRSDEPNVRNGNSTGPKGTWRSTKESFQKQRSAKVRRLNTSEEGMLRTFKCACLPSTLLLKGKSRFSVLLCEYDGVACAARKHLCKQREHRYYQYGNTACGRRLAKGVEGAEYERLY